MGCFPSHPERKPAKKYRPQLPERNEDDLPRTSSPPPDKPPPPLPPNISNPKISTATNGSGASPQRPSTSNGPPAPMMQAPPPPRHQRNEDWDITEILKKANVSSTKAFDTEKSFIAKFSFRAQTEDELTITRGTRVQLEDESDPEWWIVTDEGSQRQGFVPKSYLQSATLPLEPVWYFGMMERQKAGELLQDKQHTVGHYIVRSSLNHQNGYVLSVRCTTDPFDKGGIKHYKINLSPRGTFFITEKHEFYSMNEFTTYYKEHCGGMEVPLSQPCGKPKPPVPNRTLRDLKGLAIVPYQQINWSKAVRIGKGNFGEVYKAKLRLEDVAVKTLHQNADVDRQQFLGEANMMNKYRHPNLVQFIGVSYDERSNRLFIISEFMPGGDLQKYLKKQNNKMNINLLIRIGFQILDGMIYLEQWNVIHRDLRTANVLVGLEDVCKISDFGLMLEDRSKDANTKFPIRWTAPEAIRDVTQFSTKSDVWSFGILMVEVVTMGGNPYPDLKDIKDVQHDVLSGKVHPRPADCPQSLYDCLLICWHKDPRRRPTFAGLRNTMEQQVLDPDGQYTGEH